MPTTHAGDTIVTSSNESMSVSLDMSERHKGMQNGGAPEAKR